MHHVKCCFDSPNWFANETCPSSVDPPTPHFCMVGNGVYRGIRYLLIISTKIVDTRSVRLEQILQLSTASLTINQSQKKSDYKYCLRSLEDRMEGWK